MTAYLAVARLIKPHGMKGELVVLPLTDDPSEVLAVAKDLMPIDDGGEAVGEPLTVSRSRAYQRRWLLQFEGVESRTAVEELGGGLLGVLEADLSPPEDGEMYVHEIPGSSVIVDGSIVGSASGLIDVPGGRLLIVDIDGREVFVPFREPIVTRVDRVARSIEIDPPAGLLEI